MNLCRSANDSNQRNDYLLVSDKLFLFSPCSGGKKFECSQLFFEARISSLKKPKIVTKKVRKNKSSPAESCEKSGP